MKSMKCALMILTMLIGLTLPTAALANGVGGLWKASTGEQIEFQPDPQKVVVTVYGQGGQKVRFGGWWTTPGRAFQFRVKGEGVVSCTLDGSNPNALQVQSRHGRETWQRMGGN